MVAVAVKVGGPVVETPALDALRVARESGLLEGATLLFDSLHAQGFALGRYGTPGERRIDCPACDGRGKIPRAALTPRQQQLERKRALDTREWPDCEDCGGSGDEWEEYVRQESFVEVTPRPEDVIGFALGIDNQAVNDEKDALLRAIRGDPPGRGWIIDNEGTWKRAS